MRRLVALLLVSMLALSFSASGESGVNESTTLDSTGIASSQYADVIHENGQFDMSLTLDEDTNVTSMQWITQICINSGVCYPPETNGMDSEDGLTYSATVDVNDTAAYINWKFVLHSEDGSEASVPDTGFGWKVWSDCWWDNMTWGGSSTDCQDEEEGLPGFAAPAAVAAIAMAALMARRD
jgi:PGF-CTERM protein